jgi:ubiquinone/menaquinone biosynthesis C-methylase UbiE
MMAEVSWLKPKLGLFYEFLRRFYLRFFPDVTIILKRELSRCDTVLDLGCGHDSLIQYFNIPFSVGVELFDPSLQESKRKGIHSQYIKADIRKIEFKPKSFDAVIATEVLEHLTKQEGEELLNKIGKWARRKVIVTTPNGYLWSSCLDGYAKNPLQQHRSGWTVDELRRLGFRVFGSNGWKRLRGHKGAPKYRPTFFWARISDLTQKVTYYYPNLAFQLLAVKRVQKDDGK